MNSLVIKQGVKIIRTPEQLAEIEALSKMSYDEIDYSDIPKMTKEELKKFKPARLRKQKLQNAKNISA